MLARLSRYAVALLAYAAGIYANAQMLDRWLVPSMAARWLIAFGVGYVVLLALVRLHCAIVAPGRRLRARDMNVSDAGDLLQAAADIARTPRAAGCGGPGGRFGGGGASQAWDDAPVVVRGSSSPSMSSIDLDPGDGALVVVAVAAVAALALGVGGSLLYVLWQMPSLLAEAAAGAAVVGFASRRARVGWLDVAVRRTAKPAAISVVSLLVVGVALAIAFPGARTLYEVMLVL